MYLVFVCLLSIARMQILYLDISVINLLSTVLQHTLHTHTTHYFFLDKRGLAESRKHIVTFVFLNFKSLFTKKRLTDFNFTLYKILLRKF